MPACRRLRFHPEILIALIVIWAQCLRPLGIQSLPTQGTLETLEASKGAGNVRMFGN
jgi:hypothetical protein